MGPGGRCSGGELPLERESITGRARYDLLLYKKTIVEVVTTISLHHHSFSLLVTPFSISRFLCLSLVRKSLHSFTKASDLLHVLEVSLLSCRFHLLGLFVGISISSVMTRGDHRWEGAFMGVARWWRWLKPRRRHPPSLEPGRIS